MRKAFDWRDLVGPNGSVTNALNNYSTSGSLNPYSGASRGGNEGLGMPGSSLNPSAVSSALGVAGPQKSSAGTNSFGGMLSTTNKDGITTEGWGGLALGSLQGLGGAYLGMKQYGLAQDKFKETKRQFNKNYESQKTLTNGQLEDRQRARVASNPGAYASVGDYMKKNGVK